MPIVRRNLRARNTVVLSVLHASADIGATSVSDIASLGLSDILGACQELIWHGMVSSVYPWSCVYHQGNAFDVAGTLLAPVGDLLCMTWETADLPAALAFGDVDGGLA